MFLDRDGTINKYVGFLRNIDEFELVDGVADAIKKINTSGYLAIVVTNQPVIARSEVSFEELEEIHNKMETLLGKEGAYLDAIYFCPHHPHKGYEGERPELKFDCDCRKPKPGMLLNAARKSHLSSRKNVRQKCDNSRIHGRSINHIAAQNALIAVYFFAIKGTKSIRSMTFNQRARDSSSLERTKRTINR